MGVLMSHSKVIAFIVATFFCFGAISENQPTERDKIEAALQRIGNSDLVFVRNGSEHTGKAAAEHLRSKLKQAGESVKTFDDFVDKVATKSSLSGKPYLVKFKDGRSQELAAWLREKTCLRFRSGSDVIRSS